MKKRLLPIITAIFLLLAGCSKSPAVVATITSTNSTSSQASSATPIPLTASITASHTQTVTSTHVPTDTPPVFPSPTPSLASTPFPTFDPLTAVTHTPSPPAQCPAEDPDFVLQFDGEGFWDVYERHLDVIQQALDAGATIWQVSNSFNELYESEFGEEIDLFPLADLNGDGVLEMIVTSLLRLIIIGCDRDKYRTLLEYHTDPGGNGDVRIVAVEDMNLDGTLEIVLTYTATTGGNLVADILEWDGITFPSLTKADFSDDEIVKIPLARVLNWYDRFNWLSFPAMNGPATVQIYDTDQNGTLELVIEDNGPVHRDTLINFGPWRGQQKIFTWDGIHFIFSSLELDPPTYRFQAVNDGDRLFLLGDYARALALYQDVIFSDQLDFYSEERQIFNIRAAFAQLDGEPLPEMPSPDPDEYWALSAYARYRILLLHLATSDTQSALVVYDNLVTGYEPGSAGFPYVELAVLLFQDYQVSTDLTSACQQVVDYVEDHPEILDPLGNANYFGLQVHQYIPQDICPFSEWDLK